MGRAPTDTKKKLLETATELIWQNSYNATSVDEICAQAGVKKGSFYHYFPSKTHLALATMDFCMEDTKKVYDDIFSPTRPPLERFSLMVDHIIEQQEEKLSQTGHICGCPFATLGSEMVMQGEVFHEKINEICAKKSTYYEHAVQDFKAAGLVAEDTNVKSKADEIFAFLVGQLIMARIRNDISTIKNNMLTSLLNLLGVEKENLTDQSVN